MKFYNAAVLSSWRLILVLGIILLVNKGFASNNGKAKNQPQKDGVTLFDEKVNEVIKDAEVREAFNRIIDALPSIDNSTKTKTILRQLGVESVNKHGHTRGFLFHKIHKIKEFLGHLIASHHRRPVCSPSRCPKCNNRPSYSKSSCPRRPTDKKRCAPMPTCSGICQLYILEGCNLQRANSSTTTSSTTTSSTTTSSTTTSSTTTSSTTTSTTTTSTTPKPPTNISTPFRGGPSDYDSIPSVLDDGPTTPRPSGFKPGKSPFGPPLFKRPVGFKKMEPRRLSPEEPLANQNADNYNDHVNDDNPDGDDDDDLEEKRSRSRRSLHQHDDIYDYYHDGDEEQHKDYDEHHLRRDQEARSITRQIRTTTKPTLKPKSTTPKVYPESPYEQFETLIKQSTGFTQFNSTLELYTQNQNISADIISMFNQLKPKATSSLAKDVVRVMRYFDEKIELPKGGGSKRSSRMFARRIADSTVIGYGARSILGHLMHRSIYAKCGRCPLLKCLQSSTNAADCEIACPNNPECPVGMCLYNYKP